ncbi:MAG TPA: VOC family protein [Acidobacteriota bacterium]|nr:VOC family protein [Acidobacteriota bacterium]
MEPRVSIVTLGVEDVAKSKGFYERLGFEASPARDEAVVFFRTAGTVIALYSRASLAEDAGVDGAGAGFRGIALAYNVRNKEEVAALLTEAEAAGGRIVKSAQDAFWGGRSGYFADPDGHLWEVARNPHFPLNQREEIELL